MYERLVLDRLSPNESKPVISIWQNLEQLAISPTHFMQKVQSFYLYPHWKSDGKSRKEYDAWLIQVAENAERLARRIEGSMFDEYLRQVELNNRSNILDTAQTEEVFDILDHAPDELTIFIGQLMQPTAPLLSNALRAIAKFDREEDATEYGNSRPDPERHKKEAQRRYFIWNMAKFLLLKSGQIQNPLVTDLTNVLYPDSHVDSAKVREIGRKLKEKYSK
jgi:hypothetical protein